MRKVIVAGAALALLAGCAGGKSKSGVFGHAGAGPDEFAVARNAPLVIPPDYALAPPKPGAPRPQEADSSTQALQALFGGRAQASPGQAAIVNEAGGNAAPAGIRSEATDPGTTVVNKGALTRDIIAAPEGSGKEASASVPQ